MLMEGRTLTRESNSEFTPRGRDLPTFPLLGFQCWDVTARHKDKRQEAVKAQHVKAKGRWKRGEPVKEILFDRW